MKVLKNTLLILWQLPQVILGLILALINGFERDSRGFYHWKSYAGISLSTFFILLHEGCSDNSLNHERGHQKQSVYLGWLYLIVIGIPSFIWCCLHTYIRYFRKFDYYSFYCEKWADYLGGVHRNK